MESNSHNPLNLDDITISKSEGYRLLDKYEIIYNAPFIAGIEMYFETADQWCSCKSGYSGSSEPNTYRTKLTREELAKARAQANDSVKKGSS